MVQSPIFRRVEPAVSSPRRSAGSPRSPGRWDDAIDSTPVILHLPPHVGGTTEDTRDTRVPPVAPTTVAPHPLLLQSVGTSGKKTEKDGTAAADKSGSPPPHQRHPLFSPAVAGVLPVCILTLGVCLLTIFAPPPLGVNTGPDGEACAGTETAGSLCLCPRATVCATRWREVVFLALARCSAYLDYPLYVLLFLTKCHNLRGMLFRTYVAVWLPLDDVHHLHTLAGSVVGVEVIWHSFWHLLRWGTGGDISHLWSHQTGVTGLVMLLLTPLIVLPMKFGALRRAIRFEVGPRMHVINIRVYILQTSSVLHKVELA
jgi:hypothetical protein